MRNSHLWAVLAASVLWTTLVGSRAVAQQAPRTAVRTAVRPTHNRPTIALLDVGYIFKKHPRFKQSMDEMKADVDRAEARVKQERDAIRKLAEQAKDFRKGTPDYKAIEEEVAKRQADLTVQVQLQKKEFYQRQAKIYYNIYREIEQEVEYYTAANNIALVLRFNGDRADVQNPQEVIRDINNPVVWYARQLDITPLILDSLTKRTPRMTNQPSTHGVFPRHR